MESPEFGTPHLDIEDLAQALFLVLGNRDDSTGEPFTYELRDLEKQLLLALSQTRTINNSLSNVNSLPPEVLARIFSFLQPRILDSVFPLPQLFNSWLTVLWVCRYWRNVASAFPRLWDHVYIRKPFHNFATMSIQHSAGVPLKVYYDFNSGQPSRPARNVQFAALHDTTIALFAEQSDRLGELHISSQGSDDDSKWKILVHPAPNLEALTVITGRCLPATVRDFPILFSNYTPRLKRVTLARTWFANNFGGLTHLSLYDQRAPSVTQAEFLEILRSSPKLEELLLVRAGPDEPPPVVPTETAHAPVPLPYLKSLEIGGWSREENISFFLSRLSISKGVTRCIWGILANDLSELLNIETEGPYPDILRVAIVGDKATGQMIGIKDGTLYLHGAARYTQFQSLFSNSVLPNVLELILCPAEHTMLSSSQLRHLLVGLPTLSVLTLSGAARARIHRVSSALGMFDDAQPINDAEVPSPLLHTVNIVKYNSGGDRYLDIVPVVLLAQARAKLGYPIPRFEVEDCQRAQVEEVQGYLGETEIYLHEPPFGTRIMEEILNEMWICIRETTPTF